MDTGPWTLATPDWVLGFVLRDGMPAISRMVPATPSNAVAGANWAVDKEEVQLPQSVFVGECQQEVSWEWADVQTDTQEIRFVYRSVQPALECVSTWQSVAGHGPVEHAVSVNNNEDKEVVFSPPASIALTLSAREATRLKWVEQPGSGPSDEGTHVEEVCAGFCRSLVTSPNYSRDAVPWLCLYDSVSGEGLYGGIEFSGLTEILVERGAQDEASLHVTLGLRQNPTPPRSRIMPGKGYDLPVCFVGMFRGDEDDGSNRLHRWVQAHLRPATATPLPILVNNSWGIMGFEIDEQKTRDCIEDCKALGIEAFVVDAGWYREVGNWRNDLRKFPGGMRALADLAHAKGLKFGLWTCWSMGGVARDAEDGVLNVDNEAQKTWFTTDYPPDWQPSIPWYGPPVCLGCRDARHWCFEDLLRLVRENKLDILRQDQTLIVESCRRSDHDHLPCGPTNPNNRGAIESYQTLPDPFERRLTAEAVDVCASTANGYYEVYDRLRAKEPDLLFEGSNGGTNILDFGYLKRVHFVQADDRYTPLSNRQSFYDLSHAMPPAMIMLWLFSRAPGESVAHFTYMIRSGMLGTCAILQDTTAWSDEWRRAAVKLFQTYKTRLRPLIADGNLYRVLPRPDEKTWDGMQYYDPESTVGAVMVFRPDNPSPTQQVVLRGLGAKGLYNITSEDGSVPSQTCSGSDLMTHGLDISLPERFSSDCIWIEQIPRS